MAESYKTIRVKKRYNGLAEVRSYIFDEVQNRGMGLRFEYFDGNSTTPVEVMSIPWNQLSRGFITARGIVSKINKGQVFDLVSFKWQDDSDEETKEWMQKLDKVEKEQDQQMTMFD